MKKYYCIDCKTELSDYRSKRCRKCLNKGNRSKFYKDGRTLKNNYCKCGKRIDYRSKKCKRCANKGKSNPYWRNGVSLDRNKYMKTLLKKNMNYRIASRIRTRIWSVLKGVYKSKHTLELLGCSIEFLKGYLASKFTPGMTWEKVMNGEIHIDHIRPCSSYDLSKPEEQALCFHYTNLQPLWAKDNLIKGDRYD
jgi:hypothetical protein